MIVNIISQPTYVNFSAQLANQGQVVLVTSAPVSAAIIYDTQAFSDWKTLMFTEGDKITGRDAGLLGQQSRTDDFIYVCTKAGDAGVAVWKKFILFRSE
jgi:hypothetical protein